MFKKPGIFYDCPGGCKINRIVPAGYTTTTTIASTTTASPATSGHRKYFKYIFGKIYYRLLYIVIKIHLLIVSHDGIMDTSFHPQSKRPFKGLAFVGSKVTWHYISHCHDKL